MASTARSARTAHPPRKRRSRPAASAGPLALLALALACPPLARPQPIAAQADALGRIERMLRLQDAGTERHCGPTDDVGVRRQGSLLWQEGRCDLPLRREDHLRVQSGTVVRLRLRTPEGEGNVALSADSLFFELGGAEEGLYEIRDTPGLLTGFELVITRGSLALHWLRGQLALFNSGTRAVVSGTRLMITAGEDDESGILHLIEGSVSFPDFPEVTVAPGEWARLRPGAVPEVSRAAPPVAERFERVAEWAVEEAWARPFYRSPWVYAAAAAAVGAVAVWRLQDRDGERYGGVVILRLPW